jgi:hydrogenase maturation factor
LNIISEEEAQETLKLISDIANVGDEINLQ